MDINNSAVCACRVEGEIVPCRLALARIYARLSLISPRSLGTRDCIVAAIHTGCGCGEVSVGRKPD